MDIVSKIQDNSRMYMALRFLEEEFNSIQNIKLVKKIQKI